jgi:hypothetical protein
MAEQKYRVMPGAVSGQGTFSDKTTGRDVGAHQLKPSKRSSGLPADQRDKSPIQKQSSSQQIATEVKEKLKENSSSDGAGSVNSSSERDLFNDLEEKKKQQARKLRLMKECEGVLLVNYDWLDMPDYPSNDMLAIAQRTREYTILLNTCLAILCILSFSGVVPAWVGGSALGLSFISLCISLTALRSFVIKSPSYREIMKERQKYEFQALGHIRLLEGNNGLAWKLENLAPYNSALKKEIFQSIIVYSRAKKLLKILRRKEHIRLYLIYLIEAEKAFKRLKEDYFSTHRELQLRGIDDAS